MSRLQDFQRRMNKNSLGPKGNRKKVGIMLFSLSIIVFVIFFFRLTWIVGVGRIQGTSLAQKAESIYQGSRVIPARRGTIFDRYGNPIAEDGTSYSIYAVLNRTFIGPGNKHMYADPKNFSALANILHERLGIEVDDALNRLNTNENMTEGQTPVFQVEFGSKGNNISISTKQLIQEDMEKAHVVGLYFLDQPARIYPNGQFASFFIGQATPQLASDGSTSLVGQFGIEQAFDTILRGTDGVANFKRDASNNPILGSEEIVTPAIDGQDIYTTLDQRLQSYLETLMDQVNSEYQPETLQASLMDAKTGEILAISQRPSFNPDTGDFPEDLIWRNQAVEDAFEPGSTMKIMTVAAAIERGVFNANATYQSGQIKLWDTTINDWDFATNGSRTLTYREALTWSSNVGMVRLWEMMGGGGSVWQSYLQRFLFGLSTNSGFMTESHGLLPNIAESPVNGAMSSFGQAIQATTLQMLRAFTAFGNNGTMLEPQFVGKIVDTNNNTALLRQPEVIGQPIKAATANQVLNYMIGVTEDPMGTARSQGQPLYYGPNGIQIASKTGTAQIAGDDGKYLTGPNDYLHSVVVMAPADNPKYIIYVTLKRPIKDQTFAIPAIVNPLLRRAFENEQQPIQLDGTEAGMVKVPNVEGEGPNTGSIMMRRLTLQPTVIGSGNEVKEQSIAVGKEVAANTRIFLRTSGDATMPDVTSWTREELEEFASLANVRLHINGEGRATSQTIAFGTKLDNNQEITIELSN